MRAVEPWVEGPLHTFLRESGARVVLLMTSAGQVVAQEGFTRSLEVMAAASLGAGIVASTAEIARLLGQSPPGQVVHLGTRGVLLAPFPMARGTWVGLVVFDRDTTIGLVQFFFGRLTQELRAAQPPSSAAPLAAERFEEELDASLRTLFGR
jgi:hypothetical protein